MPKIRNGKFWLNCNLRNELNYPNKVMGYKDMYHQRLYSSMKIRKEFIWDPSNEKTLQFHGGVFNVEFSPEGSVLVAATENKSVLLFDPFTHKLMKQVSDAHGDSVNYIRFLDSRLFATCSDDCTIALWDLRNLKSKLRLFRGHSYWVKNIEYHKEKGVLITSGYDGCVNMWDINKYTQNDVLYQRLIHLSCIMRMRLTNDLTKMVICTSEGYIMVIHDLDLDTLQGDLKGFQSDLYRLMQKGHACGFDFGSWCNNVFTSKRNRVELISDFPSGNEAHSITSLDVHPYNWSILSRNISKDESSEWSCLHDIQHDRKPHELMPIGLPKEPLTPPYIRNVPAPSTVNIFTNGVNNSADRSTRRHPVIDINLHTSNSSRFLQSTQSSSSASNSATGRSSASSYVQPMEMNVSPVVIISARTFSRRAHATILNANTSYRQVDPNSPPKVYKNIPRLTYYTKELNVGPGFIKELSFSPDGRVICSPYEYGFRLLTFNENCSELSDCASDSPQLFHQLSVNSVHTHPVVTTKFSPTQLMVASACLGGKVCFYQPVL